MSAETHLLTEDQVATQFGLTVETLRNWRSQRRGPLAVKVGRKCFYLQAAIDTWLASREGASRADEPRKTTRKA